MFKTTVGIDGMACGMCEAHICSTIRKAMDVKKVSASHKKKLAEIITERPVDERLLREAIAPTGYGVTSFKCEPYEGKGFFAKLSGLFGGGKA